MTSSSIARPGAAVYEAEVISEHVDALIRLALAEDIGTGDRTTLATVAADTPCRAVVVAKEALVFAGGPFFRRVFELLDPSVSVVQDVADGVAVDVGAVVLRLEGDAHSVLAGERTALNILQRSSGIATLTQRYVAAVQGTGARVADTRKTAPGMRQMDKHAVAAGGGSNHRFGLDSGILIKDNHIVACGSVAGAVEAARARSPHGLRIEVEVTDLDELDEALAAGADIVLLDNMSTPMMAEAVLRGRARSRPVILEASGNLTIERLREVAEVGVDLLSVGALTHSARAADLSMRFLPV